DLHADLLRRLEDRDVEARALVADAVGRQFGDHQLHRLQRGGGAVAERVDGEPARRMDRLRDRRERAHTPHVVAPSFSVKPMAPITLRNSGGGSRNSKSSTALAPLNPTSITERCGHT